VTPEQEAHLGRLKTTFSLVCERKYRKGQQEHGGDLWQKSELELVDDAIDEVIDQWVYLSTLREKLATVVE
jgi:hypothetical protein